jgi:hypothetical protein
VTLVLAVRTREGHYLEFTTVRADLENGDTIAIELDDAVFVQLLDIPELKEAIETTRNAATNGHRDASPIIISGAGAIESDEEVRGLG